MGGSPSVGEVRAGRPAICLLYFADIATSKQGDPRRLALRDQHGDNVRGPVSAEELPQFLLVERNPVFAHQSDKVFRAISRERGLTEMRVIRDEIFGARPSVCEIAPSSS